jgi:hypothetical protein
MIARAVATVAALCLFGTSAEALTMKECSAKYKAAQTANTLNGQKWQDFRKAECGADASATTTAAPAAPPLAAPAAPAPKAARAPASAPPKPVAPPAMPPAAGSATFPDAISPKYSSESPGKARMHTCLDQYNANKTNNGNGGLKWIVKGGGYYSECNKHLKG